MLSHDPHTGTFRCQPVARRIALAIEPDSTRGRRQHARDDVTKRTFAGAIRTQERVDFAGLDFEVDALEYPLGVVLRGTSDEEAWNDLGHSATSTSRVTRSTGVSRLSIGASRSASRLSA